MSFFIKPYISMKIQIEMFINNKWEIHIRYYNNISNLNTFDLSNIPNKRKNAKIIKIN